MIGVSEPVPAACVWLTPRDEVELREVPLEGDNQLRAEYLELNPMGRLPTLVLPGGDVMTESLAILVALADLHPDSGLLPPPDELGRAKALRWMALLAGGFFRSLQFTSFNAIAYAYIEAPEMSRATSFASVAQQLSLSTGVAAGAGLFGYVNGINLRTGASALVEALIVAAAIALGLLCIYAILQRTVKVFVPAAVLVVGVLLRGLLRRGSAGTSRGTRRTARSPARWPSSRLRSPGR